MSIESANDLPGSVDIDPNGIVGKVAANAHETVDRAADKAQRSCYRLQALCDEAAEAPRNVIRTHPVAAVVTALAIGFIWGRIGGSR